MWRCLFILGLLAACADVPRLDLPAAPEGAPPRLVPLDGLLARADTQQSAAAGDEVIASVSDRAAALRARAARLRGPVIPPRTRARMTAGVARPALP